MFQDRLALDLKTAMLSRDVLTTETLKMLKSALTYATISAGHELTEQESAQVVKKEIKKRQEALEMFEKAGRTESARKEQAEMNVLKHYAPAVLEGGDLVSAFEVFASSNRELVDAKNFGTIMKAAIDSLGEVDKQQLSALIKSIVQ